ncbi:hypothetical protein CLV59_10243 [Chitinophaga dinghuensis]|uniref:DUF3575 domain-containing protein n=1 Tax=Chitinophaga dinghuensis TaxID=1539050 RepID=A0A327W7Y3_9BACT|nr:hypothetical protein [Chitinophaga dinghuensis]RAJ85342.1 hypothetical protein CLV59_10243 [Chitinophaga dinghuensis]
MTGLTASKKIFLLTAILVCTSIAAFCQDTTNVKYRYQHELGIDIANILTFLKKNQQSYMINYKWHYRHNKAARVGINLELSNEKSEGLYPDVRLGHQWGHVIDDWLLYGGADASVAYSKSNTTGISVWRFGVSPVVGLQYYFGRHISLATEISLNSYYYKPNDPKSFDPDANNPYYRVKIGSVGMLMISYHFGKVKK